MYFNVTVILEFVDRETVTWPTPEHHIHTVRELFEHNFQLMGEPFSNVSVWDETNVNIIWTPLKKNNCSFLFEWSNDLWMFKSFDT